MAIRISPPQNKTYYINPAHLTFNENSGYGANLIQVSASSSCYISVYDPANGIGYSDADRNYRRWKVTAYNNKFPDDKPEQRGKWYIYVRLERDGLSALVVYDQVLRGVKGGEVTVSKDESGNDVYTEAEPEQDTYWFIRIGDVGSTDGASIRSIVYDTGYLTSDEGRDTAELNEMWELDKYSTPWLIRAKQWLSSFTVKGVITLVGGLIFKKGNIEKPVTDIRRSVDSSDPDDEMYVPVDDTTLPTAAWVESMTENRFLRKDQDDRSSGFIASDKGFEVGNFVTGMIGGSGSKTYIDENGKTIMEIDKIHAREELVVPTITFNCIDVVSGEQASSFAFGTIKSVDKDEQVAELSLLEGQYGTLHTGDFCRGIFHFIEDNNESYSLDHNNFHNYSGFTTSYFKPVEILENQPGHMSFRYELQPNTSVHPEIGMNFFAYGNESDPDRQSITYTTREYKRRLVNVDDWLIVPDRNIAMQDGNLEGLTINGMEMHGYGTYQHNSYFTGVQIQFTNEQLEELRGEGAYVISLSETLGVIKKDDNGNIIYGEYTPPPGVQPSKDYVLQTQVYAYKGSFMLQYSDSEEPGTFKVGIEAVGCEASAENGIVSVSKITDVSSCYVRISAHLEGTATRETTYQILDSPSGSSGEDAVVYSITPATSIISQSTTGSLAPSAITFTSYRTVGASKSESPVYWHVRYSNDGQKWLKYYDTYVESDTFSLSQFNIGKFWQIFTTYGANSESVHLADASVTIVADGKNGADSTGLASSSLLYNCMQYKENTKYYYNSERRDVVLYQGQVYVVKNFNKDSYIVGFSPTDTTYWQQASKDIFRAMDTALIDKANIGGFMFSAKKTINGIPIGILESQYGPLIIQSVSKELPSISSMTITAKGSYVGNFGSSNSIERSKTLDIVKVVDPSVSVQYKLKPNRREIYEDNEYSLSCVIEYPNSGIELSSLPSVLSMKYKKGSTLYDYTYGSTIDVSDATGYVYFYLYYGSVEIGRITIPIGYVGILHVDNEVIALACDSDGEVTDSLPVFINPLLTARSTTVAEITSVSFNAPTGVEIAQSRMSLDAETGTLYCNNVDLTGTINANSGLIGDWKIANGSMSTEGTYYGGWITSPFKNTLDVSGMEVAIGSNDITARFGAKKVTFSEDEYQYYCSTLDIVNTQIAENRRTDPMCGIHIKGNKNDLGLFIEGAGVYISPEEGAYSIVRGLAFHARMVSSSTTLLSTDDFVVISGSETVVQLPSAGICPGKVYYIKKLSGTLKVSNVVKAGSTTTTSSESTFDNASRMFISHGDKWYEFYCN